MQNSASWVFERVLNMCLVLSMSWFWILQDCEYVGVLNFEGYVGFTCFCKYNRVLNMSGQVSQGFEYDFDSRHIRVLNMARLWMCEDYRRCWIWLNKPAYTWINRVLNMPQFWMCLMQYIAYSHCTYYWAVTETKTCSGNCQTFKIAFCQK